MILAFHKPYGVLSSFTPDGSPNRTLAEFGLPKGVYPVGRLDSDSEGLLILSDEAWLTSRLLDPVFGHPRVYWALVERVPTHDALKKLSSGVILRGTPTRSCKSWLLDPQPDVSVREPPVRFRKNVPDRWIGIELTEGKNRQVRRMTAAVGHPTLRLIRVRIGQLNLGVLQSGAWEPVTAKAILGI